MTRHTILTLTLLGLLTISAVIGFLIYRDTSPSLSLDDLPARQTNSFLQGLPPDPGEAGEATLEGIDSDNDGVRDDVQRWIAIKYPQSARVRAALRQLAVAFQSQFSGVQTPEAARSIAESVARGNACIEYVAGSQFAELESAIEGEYLNTRERILATYDFDNLLHGQVVPLPVVMADACSFDVSALPN